MTDSDSKTMIRDLRFAIAKTDDPMKADDWNIMSVDNTGGSQCRLLMLNDKPIIGYYSSILDKSIYAQESNKAIPESASDWTRKLVLPYNKFLPNTEVGFFVLNNQLGFVRDPGIFYRRWLGSTASSSSTSSSPFALIPQQKQQQPFVFNMME